MKSKGSEEYFCEGVLYAAALLNRLHDQPSISAEILKEAGIENWDCSGLEEFEKTQLRIINKEKGMKLKGL